MWQKVTVSKWMHLDLSFISSFLPKMELHSFDSYSCYMYQETFVKTNIRILFKNCFITLYLLFFYHYLTTPSVGNPSFFFLLRISGDLFLFLNKNKGHFLAPMLTRVIYLEWVTFFLTSNITLFYWSTYSKVLNNSAVRLLIFKIFPTNTALFGPTRLLKFR